MSIERFWQENTLPGAPLSDRLTHVYMMFQCYVHSIKRKLQGIDEPVHVSCWSALSPVLENSTATEQALMINKIQIAAHKANIEIGEEL
jgi:hypothetical protein